jgi:hypothetical protein
LRVEGNKLDAVYVSHIDQDHIQGVVQLLEDELEWRLFDHHESNGTPIRKPKFPRPPEIDAIWHNAFRDQVGKNAGDIKDMLAAAAPALILSSLSDLVELGEEMQHIALSIPEAILVSRYASPELLGIPVNRLPGAADDPKLLMVRGGQPAFDIGSMRFTIVGPTRDELDQLRAGWNNYLRDAKGKEAIRKLRAEIRKRIDDFTTSGLDLRDWNGIEDFKGVTTPNIASLMFMVEENGKRLLLTGDSQQDIILKGLEVTKFLDNGYIHVDALKMQHHGSENNMDENFGRRVSADHYIFCGNGSHGNPELSVIQQVYDSRLDAKKKRALAPEAADRPFTFWFSTSSSMLVKGSEQHENFEAAEQLVSNLVAKSGGQLISRFNADDSLTLEI